MDVVPNIAKLDLNTWGLPSLEPYVFFTINTVNNTYTFGPSKILDINFSLNLYDEQYFICGKPGTGYMTITLPGDETANIKEDPALLFDAFITLYIDTLSRPELMLGDTPHPGLAELLGNNIRTRSRSYSAEILGITQQVTEVTCSEGLNIDQIYYIAGTYSKNGTTKSFYNFLRSSYASDVFYVYVDADTSVTVTHVQPVNLGHVYGTWRLLTFSYDIMSDTTVIQAASENNYISEYLVVPDDHQISYTQLTEASFNTLLEEMLSSSVPTYKGYLPEGTYDSLDIYLQQYSLFLKDEFFEAFCTLQLKDVFLSQYNDCIITDALYGTDPLDQVYYDDTSIFTDENILELQIDQTSIAKYTDVIVSFTADPFENHESITSAEQKDVHTRLDNLCGIIYDQGISQEVFDSIQSSTTYFDRYLPSFRLEKTSYSAQVYVSEQLTPFYAIYLPYVLSDKVYYPNTENNTAAVYTVPNSAIPYGSFFDEIKQKIRQKYLQCITNSLYYLKMKVAANPGIWIGTRVFIKNNQYGISHMYKVYRIEFSYSGFFYTTLFLQYCED